MDTLNGCERPQYIFSWMFILLTFSRDYPRFSLFRNFTRSQIRSSLPHRCVCVVLCLSTHGLFIPSGTRQHHHLSFYPVSGPILLFILSISVVGWLVGELLLLLLTNSLSVTLFMKRRRGILFCGWWWFCWFATLLTWPREKLHQRGHNNICLLSRMATCCTKWCGCGWKLETLHKQTKQPNRIRLQN